LLNNFGPQKTVQLFQGHAIDRSKQDSRFFDFSGKYNEVLGWGRHLIVDDLIVLFVCRNGEGGKVNSYWIAWPARFNPSTSQDS
jgi:hypothetical protein